MLSMGRRAPVYLQRIHYNLYSNEPHQKIIEEVMRGE